MAQLSPSEYLQDQRISHINVNTASDRTKSNNVPPTRHPKKELNDAKNWTYVKTACGICTERKNATADSIAETAMKNIILLYVKQRWRLYF